MSINNQEKNSSKKVVVALTGREDSAVAAFLLKKQGYQVIGLSMLVANDDIVSNKDFLPKCHIVDLEKVKEFCEKIKIPFYATDAKGRFENDVVDKLVSNKLTARANSSCFNCTQMRMHVLYEKMIALKADYIATGHYCKVYKNLNSDEYFIHSNNDSKSDQSLLLAGMDQKFLKHLMLPLGELRQEEVSKISKNFNLFADKSIVQDGFCFKLKEATEKILSSRIPKSMLKAGQIVNNKTEMIHGDHKGMAFHYLTEKEFEMCNGGILDKSVEIIDYNYSTGQIIVGDKKHLSFSGTQVTSLMIGKGLDKRRPLTCYIKFKYSNEFVKGTLFFKNNQTAYLDFTKEVYPLIKGENMVIYDSNNRNSKIIGYAHIGTRGNFEAVDRVKFFKSELDLEKEASENGKKTSLFKF
jgi:tRNA-specific 2-thiouridylase